MKITRESLILFFSAIIVVSAAVLSFFYWPIIEYNFTQFENQANDSQVAEKTNGLEKITGTEKNTANENLAAVAESNNQLKANGNYLVIKKIGVEIAIVEGPDTMALGKGAWLLPGTSTPDEMGNTALAGHRFLYRPPSKKTFYLLDKVEKGDVLNVFWEGKEYRYIVAWTDIVDPKNIDVIKPTEKPSLTLITCTPLFTDEKRLIVRGELEGIY